MRYTVDVSSLAYALVSAAVPSGTTVLSGAMTDTVQKLPAVIVSVSAPTPVGNDPSGGASAECSIAVSAYSTKRAEASALADTVYAGLIRAWQAGTITPFGWIARVDLGLSILPQQVAPTLAADDLSRFDIVLPVIARH